MTKTLLLTGAALLSMSGGALAQTTSLPAQTGPNPPGGNNVNQGSPTDPQALATPGPDGTAPTGADPIGATPPTSATAGAAMPSPDGTTPQSMTADAAPTTTAQPMTADVATATTTAPAAPDASTQTAAAVQGEWGKYDTTGRGALTPLEFGKWVMAANGQDVSAQVESTRTSKRSELPAIKVLNATAASFSKADTNQDKLVSPDELSTFLGRG